MTVRPEAWFLSSSPLKTGLAVEWSWVSRSTCLSGRPLPTVGAWTDPQSGVQALFHVRTVLRNEDSAERRPLNVSLGFCHCLHG